ncbi:MAG: hypothetical protein WAX07_01280 [Candidatus Altiarchaeia archaeon]
MAIESGVWGPLSGFLQDLLSKALTGDVFAVSAVLIGFYFLVLLVQALTTLFILLLKRLILLVIVSLASYQFAQYMSEKLASEGMTNDNLFLGGLGLIGGILAMILALNALFVSVKKAGAEKEVPEEKAKETAKGPEAETQSPAFSSEEVFSVDNLKKDRSLGVVVAYLIVAEFGVISSKTVAAPNATVGMLFFFAFMLAALFFIRQTYQNYNTGIRHFVAVLIIGGLLSFILGALWGGYSINQLLSTEYFTTDSMVAFLTGIAVSLFMGSKG